MKMCMVLLPILILSACGHPIEEAVSERGLEENPVWTRLHTPSPGKLRYLLERRGVDVTGSSHRYGFVDVHTTPDNLDRIVDRYTRRIELVEALDTTGRSRALSDYMDPAEISGFLDQVQNDHPAIAQKITLEDTLFEGQALYAMKISDNVTIDEDEPTYQMDGQTHAREVMTAEVMVDAIDYLTDNYGVDPQVTRWVNEMEIWIVPVINPDGAMYVHTADNWWRKNRHPGCEVDLNRNCSWSWDTCNGSSGECWADDYRGTAPASEPETQAMEALFLQVRPMYYINYHTNGEYIIWPGGCAPVEEDELFWEVGRDLNNLVETDDGTTGNWAIGNSAEVLYLTDGAFDDQAYGVVGAISFTFELNAWDFQPDYATWRDVTVQRQRAGWGYLLDRTLDGPSVRGHTYDSVSTAPVVATFEFANHPFTSDQLPLQTDAHGRFGRAVLSNSEHVIVFTAPGYLPETRTVQVVQAPVDLDVPMTAGVNHAPTVSAGGAQAANEGDTVALSAAGSDPDGNTLFFQWIQTQGPPVLLQDAYTDHPVFCAPSVDQDTDLIFEVTASDGELTSAPDSVTVTVRDVWDQTTLFPSTDTPIAIPDADPVGIDSILGITEDRLILKATVEVDISHTWIGDLVVTLTSPAGTLVVLHDHEGGSDQDLHAVYDLPAVACEMSGGDWTLHVRDTYGSDTGTLNTWILSLDLVGEATCTTAADCDLPNVNQHACNAGNCEIVSCDPGFGDCNALAVDGCEVGTDSNPLHCGTCNNSCSFPHAGASCVGGSCVMGPCQPPWEDCNGSAADGCEADPQTDPDHCGGCDQPCQLPHSTAACLAGSCVVEQCDSLWDDCDGLAANGCESDTSTDPDNCGACDQACDLPHAQSACVLGACEVQSCLQAPGESWADCDDQDPNGCEVNTETDPGHCGTCGLACDFPNAQAGCVGGACEMGACLTGFMDCNAGSADGCETDVRADPANCGQCDLACDFPNAGATCVSSQCRLGECLAGFSDCNLEEGDGCESDVSSDPLHCGGCETTCSLPNAVAGCADSACTVEACEDSYGDCNGDPLDGCETYLNNNDEHCGECDNTCTFPNSTATCRNGQCRLDSCDTDYANCNDVTEDGCEVILLTDPENCGGCDQVCAYDHATADCDQGSCLMGGCESGFGNCNDDPSDGCEANVSSDPQNCGSCGSACPDGNTCVAGTCHEPCPDADEDGHSDDTCGGDDCDDSDAAVHPGAAEVCNLKDDDCNGQADDDPACEENGGGDDGCGCGGSGGPASSIFLFLLGLAGLRTRHRRRSHP